MSAGKGARNEERREGEANKRDGQDARALLFPLARYFVARRTGLAVPVDLSIAKPDKECEAPRPRTRLRRPINQEGRRARHLLPLVVRLFPRASTTPDGTVRNIYIYMRALLAASIACRSVAPDLMQLGL